MPSPIRVLFICTGNCCRSQMAEAILRHLGGTRVIACSAGSQPAGFVHPIAVETLRRMGISTDGLRSKGLDVFADDPPEIHITVCDSAAAEVCPRLPGKAPTAHWSLPDPSFAPGTREDQIEVAIAVAYQAKAWIEQLLALPLETMTDAERRTALQKIAI